MNIVKLKSIFLVVLIAIFISGCVARKEGVLVPKENDVAKRSKYKVYVDNSATIKAEKEFLELTKELLSKEIETNIIFELKDVEISEPNEFEVDNFASLTSKEEAIKKIIELPFINLSSDSYRQFLKNVVYKTEKNKVHYPHFKIEDRSLVSKKKYDTKSEIIKDFMNLMFILNSNTGKELATKTGFQLYVLDGNGLKENKLVLQPLTKVFSLKQVFDRNLKTYGYQVVQNEEEADKIFETEILYYAHKKYMKDSKRASNITTPKNITSDFNHLAMNTASALGATNSDAAAIGLALVALNILGGSSSTLDEIVFNTIAKYYDKEDKNNFENISILQSEPKIFGSIYHIYDKYIVNKDKDMQGNIGQSAESYITYMDGGALDVGGGKALKTSPKHAHPNFLRGVWQRGVLFED